MPNQYKPYTEKEMDIVKQNYGKITCEEICSRFLPHRKPHNLITLACKLRKQGLLNLSSNLDHSKEQIRKMAETKCNSLSASAYQMSPELAYILGVMLGDGSLTKRRIGLITIDKDFALNFKKKLEKWSGLKGRLYKYFNKQTYIYKQGFCYSVFLNSRKARDFVKGLIYYRKTQRIYWKYLKKTSFTKEQKIAFLQGLYDSEGCIKTYRIDFSNTSYWLILLVKKHLNSLQIKPNISKGKKVKDRLRNYRVDITGKKNIFRFHSLISFSIKRKQNALNEMIASYKKNGHA
jgi:hypothetical protein